MKMKHRNLVIASMTLLLLVPAQDLQARGRVGGGGFSRGGGVMLADVSKPQNDQLAFRQNGTAGETIVFQKQ